MRNVTFIAGLALTVVTSFVNAQSESGIYINPKVSVAEFSRLSSVSDEALYGLGVGYRFDDPVAIEVSYVTGDSSVRNRAATSADVDVWSVSALYHFLETDNISPFFIMGVGEQDISLADQGSESHVNAGLGLRWRLFRNLDARAQYSFYDGQEFGGLKRIFDVGLQYTFGSKTAEPPRVIDADNDGVRDSQDSCLGTPANQRVNARGCPLRVDSDRDGVYDDQDQCQGTFDRSRKIDRRGCYVPEIVMTPEQMKVIFYFAFDSAELTPEHKTKARRIARFLRGGTNNSVLLAGHTDSKGSDAYNQKLASERADAVRRLLTEVAGLTDREIQRVSYGESRPVASNASNSSRQQNRRVEAEIRTKKSSKRR